MQYVRILIDGVSEIDGHIFDTCCLDQNEDTSPKHVSCCALFSRYDRFKYQSMRRAGSCVMVQGRHFEQML
jgi:hypothetical protein